MSGIYLGIALIGGAGFLLAVALLIAAMIRQRREQAVVDDRGQRIRLPFAPLQRRAFWSLGIGVFVALIVTAVVLFDGAEAWSDKPALRILVEGVFVAGLCAYLVVLLRTRMKDDDSEFDERDRNILAGSTFLQGLAVIVSLAVWAIVLTERYWDQGAIPLAYPQLIFISACIINMLAGSMGILLGYWTRG